MEFNIPQSMPSIVKDLILNSPSMENDEEIQYWFDIWDSLNELHQQRLQQILQTEKDKLEALEKKYQEEISKLNLNNSQEFEFIKDKDKSEMLEYINL